MTRERLTRTQFLMTGSGWLIGSIAVPSSSLAQAPTDPGPAYRSGRRSLFQLTPPPGKPLQAGIVDTGIEATARRAERVLSYSADASKFAQGELVLGCEYGRIEIMDSDDKQIRLQVRQEANTAKAIEDTRIRVHLTSDAGVLRVMAWNETQGFGAAVAPCNVNIRLQVPGSGLYKIDATANHGCVGVHRLKLAGCKLRGPVGVKVPLIKGYQGGHDLDDVVVSGDLDLATDAPQGFGDAWIHGTMRVASSCNVMARTNEGHIRLSFSSDSPTGVDVTGRSDEGKVTFIGFDANGKPPTTKSGADLSFRSEEFESKPIRVVAKANSSRSDVTIVAPL